jgi:hypothetical protein
MIRTKKVIDDYITHDGVNYIRDLKLEGDLITIQWWEIYGYESNLVEYYHSDKGWMVNDKFNNNFETPDLEVMYHKMISEIPPLI